jgi:hypothetical protein
VLDKFSQCHILLSDLRQSPVAVKLDRTLQFIDSTHEFLNAY